MARSKWCQYICKQGKVAQPIKRTNINLTDNCYFRSWEWEVFSPKFWCPKMARSIVNSQFSSLDHLCLLPLPTKTHQRKQVLALPFEGEGWDNTTRTQQESQPSGTLIFLGERETVTTTVFSFYRKILEFNSWLGVFYIQMFRSITDWAPLILIRKYRITLSSLISILGHEKSHLRII